MGECPHRRLERGTSADAHARPASWTRRATWTRLFRLSLTSSRDTCAFTVATLMNSPAAISAFDLPRPSASATSRSRSLRAASAARAPVRLPVAVWILTPLLLGTVRVLRREVA